MDGISDVMPGLYREGGSQAQAAVAAQDECQWDPASPDKRRRASVWSWQAIDRDNQFDVAGAGDSLERIVALRLLASQTSGNTRDAYRRDLNYFMFWWQDEYSPVLLAREHGDPRTPIQSTRADLEQYMNYLTSLEDPLAPATINRRIAVVASFFNRAIDDPDIPVETNPAARLKRPRVDNDVRTGLSAEDARNLWQTARGWPDQLEGTLVMALLLLGLRISEAVNLTSEDVIRDGGFVKITPKRKGKDSRPMLVVDDDELAGRLERLAAQGPTVFGTVDRRAGARIVAKLGQAAGLDRDLYPHLLRHTFVTELIRSGLNLEEVRVLAGHSRIETTQRYARAIEAETKPVAGLLRRRYERT